MPLHPNQNRHDVITTHEKTILDSDGFRPMIGITIDFLPQGETQTVIKLKGDQALAAMATIALIAEGGGMPVAHVKAGAGGTILDLICDIGRGVCFTVPCAALEVNITNEIGWALPANKSATARVGGYVVLGTQSGHRPGLLTRTVLRDGDGSVASTLLTFNAGAFKTLIVPSFARTFQFLREGTEPFTLDFLDINNQSHYQVDIGVGQQMEQFQLSGPIRFITITNTGANPIVRSCGVYGLSF